MANLITNWLNSNNFTELRDKVNALVNVLKSGTTGQFLTKSGNGDGEFQWTSYVAPVTSTDKTTFSLDITSTSYVELADVEYEVLTTGTYFVIVQSELQQVVQRGVGGNTNRVFMKVFTEDAILEESDFSLGISGLDTEGDIVSRTTQATIHGLGTLTAGDHVFFAVKQTSDDGTNDAVITNIKMTLFQIK